MDWDWKKIFGVISTIYFLFNLAQCVSSTNKELQERNIKKEKIRKFTKDMEIFKNAMEEAKSNGMTDKAKKYFEEAKKDNKLGYYLEAFFFNNWDEESKKRFEKAYEYGYGEAGGYLGIFEEDAGNKEKAISIYKEAVEKKSGTALYKLAKIYFLDGEIEKVKQLKERFDNNRFYGMREEYYENLLVMIEGEKEEKEYLKLEIEARKLEMKKDYKGAISKYEKAKKYNESDAKAEIGRIIFFKLDDKDEKGSKLIVESANEGSVRAYEYIIMSSILTKDFEEAEKNYKVLIDAGLEQYKLELAKLIKNQPNRQDEAEKLLLEVLDYRFSDVKIELLSIYLLKIKKAKTLEEKQELKFKIEKLVTYLKDSKGEFNLEYFDEILIENLEFI